MKNEISSDAAILNSSNALFERKLDIREFEIGKLMELGRDIKLI